jgi:hypothetical protein
VALDEDVTDAEVNPTDEVKGVDDATAEVEVDEVATDDADDAATRSKSREDVEPKASTAWIL